MDTLLPWGIKDYVETGIIPTKSPPIDSLQWPAPCWGEMERLWVTLGTGTTQVDNPKHYSDVTWASWCFRSSKTHLFVEQIVQDNFVRGIHQWPEVPWQRASNARSISILWCHYGWLLEILPDSVSPIPRKTVFVVKRVLAWFPPSSHPS